MSKIIVIKVGGALSTIKNGKYEINIDLMKIYAKTIKREWSLFERKVIFVLGGGSFGNVAPLEYNLVYFNENTKKIDICEMTLRMFSYVMDVVEIFRKEGIACYPFQTSAICTTDNYLVRNSFADSIRMCLDLGIMPIMSGDLTFDKKEVIHIFSSDKVPELFLNFMDIGKVIYLTDIDGFYLDITDKSSFVEEINKDNFEFVISSAIGSKYQDVTGGMYSKLMAMKRLSEYGIHSVVLCGRDPENMISILKDKPILATRFES